jgi:hypothetical protein
MISRSIDKNGTIHTFKDDKLHSYNDLPAVEYADGTKYWYKNGEIHRLTGSAISYSYREAYYINDKELTKDEYNRHPLVKFTKYWLKTRQ